MAAKYGFGQSLSVPLKAATSVYPSGMTPSELAQSAFGQYDDKATVLQTAMVSSAIANGGVLEKPQLVQKVLSPSLDTVSQLTPMANNPQVAVAVVVENGGGLGQPGYGNVLAAPIAKKVMEAVLAK